MLRDPSRVAFFVGVTRMRSSVNQVFREEYSGWSFTRVLSFILAGLQRKFRASFGDDENCNVGSPIDGLHRGPKLMDEIVIVRETSRESVKYATRDCLRTE